MEVTPTSPASMTLRVGLGAAMVGPVDDVQRICCYLAEPSADHAEPPDW